MGRLERRRANITGGGDNESAGDAAAQELREELREEFGVDTSE
jgi:hypothetical protein